MDQKFFKVPFASGGDVTPIPNDATGDGSVSFQIGYGVNYSLDPATNPSALLVERTKQNALFGDMTEALQQYQIVGTPEFITDTDNGGDPYEYGAGARVRYRADPADPWVTYISLVDANDELPTVTTHWTIASAGLLALTGLTNANVTLTRAQAQAEIITLAGTLTANIQIILPATRQMWIIRNATSGAFTVTAKTAAGTGVVATQGLNVIVFGDGTNIYALDTVVPDGSITTAKLADTAVTGPKLNSALLAGDIVLVNSTTMLTSRLVGVNRTSNWNFVANDRNKLSINESATPRTGTLPAAASLVDGWASFVLARAAGSVIASTGTELLINGLGSLVSSYTLSAGEMVRIVLFGGVYFVMTINQRATTASPGIVEQATAAEVRAETANFYPDAASIRNSPGVLGAWAKLNGTGTIALLASYNISGTTDHGTGEYTFTTTTNFQDVNNSPVYSGQNTVNSSITNEISTSASACRSLSRNITIGSADINPLNLAWAGNT
jgi:hypothetical protein